MSNLDTRTRSLILAYLGGELDIDDVRRRFMPLAWALDESSSREDPLAAKVSLYLAEFSRGHRDADDLRSLLEPLVVDTHVAYGATPLVIGAGMSFTTWIRMPQLATAGTRREEEFGRSVSPRLRIERRTTRGLRGQLQTH